MYFYVDSVNVIGGSCKVTLVVAFCHFAPKVWESGGDLQIIFYHSMSAVYVVSTLIGDENT